MTRTGNCGLWRASAFDKRVRPANASCSARSLNYRPGLPPGLDLRQPGTPGQGRDCQAGRRPAHQLLSQRLIHQFLVDNDLDSHIARIKEMYRQQRTPWSPPSKSTSPKRSATAGRKGHVCVGHSAEGMSSVELLKEAINLKVAFVPGGACYVDGGGQNTMRLGYATSDEAKIREGIKRLAQAIMKQWRR